jgi:hypothetical protein
MSQTVQGQAGAELPVYTLGHTDRELNRLIARQSWRSPSPGSFFRRLASAGCPSTMNAAPHRSVQGVILETHAA